jgi:hypothetical protein
MSDLAGTVVPAEFRTFCEGSGTDSTKLGRKMRKMSKINTITSNFPLKFCHHACRSECNTILLYSIKWVKCMKYINPLFMDHGRIRQRKPLSPSPKLSRSSIFQQPPPTHFSIHQSVADAYLPLYSGSLEPKPPCLRPPGLLPPLSSRRSTKSPFPSIRRRIPTAIYQDGWKQWRKEKVGEGSGSWRVHGVSPSKT